ncbi:MAG: hypothetical protein ACJ77V_06205 [Chloroflexota bacterium]
MPIWRCPHCGTPQAETARCWVCRRSSTACASCRNFRRSVAAQVGFCGLDRQRRPLHGDEIRPCWESRPDVPETPAAGIPRGAATPAASVEDRTPVRRLEFVEVGTGAPLPAGRASAGAPMPASRSVNVDDDAVSDPPSPVPSAEMRWSLWGDLEG